MKSTITAAGMLTIVFSQIANAQVASDPWIQQHGDAQAHIAFTVPLGHSPHLEETAPRIELMVRQRAASGEFAALRRADDERWNERRLGLSLGDNPGMMLNGRGIVREERKHGIQDGVLIAGGTVVATVILSLLLLDVDRSESDN